jgi:hypothetical protein
VEDPIQIDLYLTIASGTAGLGGIEASISFEIEALIPSNYTVNFVQYLVPAGPIEA